MSSILNEVPRVIPSELLSGASFDVPSVVPVNIPSVAPSSIPPIVHCTKLSFKCSNPKNNHDEQKIKYKTRKDAEIVMQRMIRQPCNRWERLNVYKNKNLGTWHVGWSSLKRK